MLLAENGVPVSKLSKMKRQQTTKLMLHIKMNTELFAYFIYFLAENLMGRSVNIYFTSK